MVSEGSHRLFVKILKIGQFLGLTRFFWDEKCCRLVYREKGFHVWREKIHLIFLLAYNVFLITRGYQIVGSDHVPSKKKVSISYFIIIFALLTSHQSLCILKGREFCAFINGLMIFTNRVPAPNKRSKGRANQVALRKDEKDFRRLKRFIWMRICMSLFAGGTNCLTAIRKPENPLFLMSLSQGPIHGWLRLAGSSFHVYIYVAQYYYLLLVIATTMYSCYCAIPAIKQLDIEGTKWMQYRTIYVLQAYYNRIFMHWMSSQILVDTIGAIINIYFAVILNSWRGMVITCLVLFSAGWSLTEYSSVHETSTAVLQRWLEYVPGRPDWFGKFHKSCHPITVKNGAVFHVDRSLILTLATIIIDKTTSLLVLHSN